MPRTPLRRLLPVVWGMGCLLGFSAPGDEYGLFALGSLLGVWVAFLLPSLHSPAGALLPVLAVGCGLMYGFGCLLDRLHARVAFWLCAWSVCGVAAVLLLLSNFATYEQAIARNGSLLAYLVCGSQLGAAAATLLAGIVAAVARYVALVRGDLARG